MYGIKDGIFYGTENAIKDKKFIVPWGVTAIADRAFMGEPVVEIIILPDTVKKIGDESFAYIPQLKEIVYNGNLEEIGTHTFDLSGVSSIGLGWKEAGRGISLKTKK